MTKKLQDMTYLHIMLNAKAADSCCRGHQVDDSDREDYESFIAMMWQWDDSWRQQLTSC